ncbi:hypothetical protein MMC18_003743 [Xylographa bjoerkii]|nr:hypothetical protein [Xylographa bjoerkii]
MAVRGQRFHLDLDSEDDESTIPRDGEAALSSLGLDFVRDVCERPSAASAHPPIAPIVKTSATGFPAHKKRVRTSAFKQQRTTAVTTDGQTLGPGVPFASDHGTSRIKPTGLRSNTPLGAIDNTKSGEAEKKAIDEENQQTLAQMSAEEIERERAELLAGMSSSLIDRLLKRANIDEGRTDIDEGFGINAEADTASLEPHISRSGAKMASKKVTFDAASTNQNTLTQAPKVLPTDLENPPMTPPKDLKAAASFSLAPPNIHFPRPPEAPSLDPSDPNFLENMHARYFPEFPVDPNKLAWMAPIPAEGSPADQDSPYNPSQDALTISSIRFDFRGRLIPPRLARQIPVTQGLHHHGQAPEAAGYTIPELAHLSRSSVPAQRCIAYQTLGRVLYRLGRGDFGNEGEDLYLGLWKCVEEGRVVDTLAAEANKEDGKGNRSCKVTATEALWLWQKGGGKKWKAQ